MGGVRLPAIVGAMTATFSIDATPNPNARKITVSAPISPGTPLTFNSAVEAEKHPLVRALFAIPGVRSVFVVNNFATVTKEPDADWNAIEPRLRDAVTQQLQGKAP